MKKIIFILIATATLLLAPPLPPGTTRLPVYTDAGGNVLSTPLVFSNQFVMVPAPSVSNHVARIMDVTNGTVSSLFLTNVASADGNITATRSGRTITLQWNNVSNFVTSTITNGLVNNRVLLLNGSATNLTVYSNLTVTSGNLIGTGNAATNFFYFGDGGGLTNVPTGSFVGILPISKGGTGTNTTLLVGNYTNVGSFNVLTNLIVGSSSGNAHSLIGTVTNFGSMVVTNAGTVLGVFTATNASLKLGIPLNANNLKITNAAPATASNDLVTLNQLVTSTNAILTTGLTSISSNASSTITTTAATDTVIPSMSITPAAGTYLVWFTTSISADANSRVSHFSIYTNGVQIIQSEIHADFSSANEFQPVAVLATATANGSTAIEARARIVAGAGTPTGTLTNRTLTILKIQ